MSHGDGYRDRYASAYVGKKVCLTGGAGFIGSHLASDLLDLGADLAVIDDLSSSDGEHLWYLIDTYPERVKFCFASILDPAALGQAVAGCDVVFHLAAMNSVPRSLEDPERCFAVNTLGTVRVCGAAQAAGVKRIVLAGSSSVYGDNPTLPKIESMVPSPASPYAASKLAAEAIVHAWWNSYGVSGVVLRYFNIFGPRQPADSPYAGVVAAFLHALIQGRAPVIYGDGSQSRDFTPVANAVHATLLAGLAEGAALDRAINIGCGERTTVKELAQLVAEAVGRADVTPEYKPERRGDVPHSLADISRARAVLGYEPIKDLQTGLTETAAWMKRQAVTGASPQANPPARPTPPAREHAANPDPVTSDPGENGPARAPGPSRPVHESKSPA